MPMTIMAAVFQKFLGCFPIFTKVEGEKAQRIQRYS
jgi:hypothetical protein